jgi:hypothetical protein
MEAHGLYAGPVLETARSQFDQVDIPADERSRLLYRKRAIAVSAP